MYSDPTLFTSASLEFSRGLEKLNSCKNAILNYSGSHLNHAELDNALSSAESTVSACDALALDKIIKDTTAYLCSESDEFRTAYQDILFDMMNSELGNLSSTQYNFVSEQNEYLILQQLQEYEKAGTLNEEGKQMLKYQEFKIANIEITKKMSGMATTDPEYVNLYTEYVKNQEEMIKLDPNKTEEEKQVALSELRKTSAYTLDVLSLGRDINIKGDELEGLEEGTSAYYEKQNEQFALVNALYDKQISYLESLPTINADTLIQLGELREKKHTINQYIELNNLYLSGASKDVIAEKKVEMGIANAEEQDLYEWNNMDWWEKAWEQTKTVGATIYTSFASIGENLIDGALMLTVGTVGRLGNDAAAKWTEEFTSFNFADYTYDSFVKDGGLNSVSAYSAVHNTTDFIATTGGYICLSLIPGGGGTVVMAVAGGGSATQTAFDNGASFDEAWDSTVINAVLSAGADIGLNKVNASTTLSGVQKAGLRTLIGAGEPGANMVSEYFLYGRDKTPNFLDYGIKSGGFFNMVIGGTVANVSGFFQDYKKFKMQNVEISRQLELEYKKMADPSLDDWDKARVTSRISELENIDEYSSDIAKKLSEKMGINVSEKQIKEIIISPKGARPLPKEIFGVEYEQKFLKKYFSDGIIKCTSGVPPGLGGFFSSKSEIDAIILKALSDGDNVQKILEKSLDVKPGDFDNLSFSFPVDSDGNIITDINKIFDVNGKGISIPSGNERNAYSGLWEPGGFTKSGMPEVSIGTIDEFKTFSLDEYVKLILGG